MDQPGNNHVLLRAHQVAHPGGAASDRMRELLTRTAADHVTDEWLAADTIEALHRRVGMLERQVQDLLGAREAAASADDRTQAQPGQTLAGIAATLDGLAATLGTLEHKTGALDNRLERLDERLDDQYDRVTSLDGRLGAADTKIDALSGQLSGQFEEARADVSGRLASLEEMVFTLAEVLLRPTARFPHALENGARP